jgi:hypothetical protein
MRQSTRVWETEKTMPTSDDHYGDRMRELEEKKQLLRLTRLDEELTEVLHSHRIFLIRDCRQRGIVLPHLERTIDFMNKAQALIQAVPSSPSPEVKRSQKSPGNGTEPGGKLAIPHVIPTSCASSFLLAAPSCSAADSGDTSLTKTPAPSSRPAQLDDLGYTSMCQ